MVAPQVFAEGPYYFKNGGNDNFDGLSDATAWANPSVKLDGKSFKAGTDFYFKQGDTFTVSNDIDINHSGVDANNRAVFRCYKKTGDFECTGTKPIVQNSALGSTTFRLNNKNKYLTFKDLDIRNSNSTWKDTGGVGIGTKPDISDGGNAEGGNIIIDNCRFYHFGHYAAALSQMGDYNIVTNNTCEESGNCFYFIDEANDGSSLNYIADNTCIDLPGYKNTDGHCVGLQRAHYSIVENNNSTDAFAAPYVTWAGNRHSTTFIVFKNNTTYGSVGGGIFVAGGPNDSKSYGNLVYGNVITDTASKWDREAIRISAANSDFKGNRVFNNTIYNAGTVGIGVKDDTDYTYWKNNIIHTNDLKSKLFRFQTDGGHGNNMIIDHNLYWTASGSPESLALWEDTNDSSYNFGKWKSSRNKDLNGLISNPKFTAAGSKDFTLKSDSLAIDAGGYLSYVIETSGKTITVADTYWFHGDYGLVNADGEAVKGMQITFYDKTYGLQHRAITSDFINHGAPGNFVVDKSINHIYNAANLSDPSYTTQVSLRFFGTKPDIGAKEAKQDDGDTGDINSLQPPSNISAIMSP